MKKIISIVFAGAMLFTNACKKESSNSTTPTTPASKMNATESSLVGTWFLKKERDSAWSHYPVFNRDTIFTGYANTAYIKFTADAAGTHYQLADGMNLSTNIVAPADKLSPGTISSLWYYDESVKLLIISANLQYVIKSQSNSELVLHCKQGGGNKYYYFSK